MKWHWFVWQLTHRLFGIKFVAIDTYNNKDSCECERSFTSKKADDFESVLAVCAFFNFQIYSVLTNFSMLIVQYLCRIDLDPVCIS